MEQLTNEFRVGVPVEQRLRGAHRRRAHRPVPARRPAAGDRGRRVPRRREGEGRPDHGQLQGRRHLRRTLGAHQAGAAGRGPRDPGSGQRQRHHHRRPGGRRRRHEGERRHRPHRHRQGRPVRSGRARRRVGEAARPVRRMPRVEGARRCRCRCRCRCRGRGGGRRARGWRGGRPAAGPGRRRQAGGEADRLARAGAGRPARHRGQPRRQAGGARSSRSSPSCGCSGSSPAGAVVAVDPDRSRQPAGATRPQRRGGRLLRDRPRLHRRGPAGQPVRPGVWLDVGDGTQVHLSEGEGGAHPDQHVAFDVDDFDGIHERAVAAGAAWGERGPGRATTRDPAGNLIELFA